MKKNKKTKVLVEGYTECFDAIYETLLVNSVEEALLTVADMYSCVDLQDVHIEKNKISYRDEWYEVELFAELYYY